MQQLFDEYIRELTGAYAEVLEDVGVVSKVMSVQSMSNKRETPLTRVVKMDVHIPILKEKYPQFAYITESVFQDEELFDNSKNNVLLFPEFFPEYSGKKEAMKAFLMPGVARCANEEDCNFLLNYLENNNFKERCWSECFATIYKRHQFLRQKVTDAFYSFLNRVKTLRIPCGKNIISVFDCSKSSACDIIKLLQKMYEKADPNYIYISEKKELDALHFFHYLSQNDIPKDYNFIKMLYHTRYLNGAEFGVACSNMNISKITDYDFSLAQRILPRLLACLSKMPYPEAVDVIRGKKKSISSTYLENEQWLAERALAFAEVFGVKFEAYLNKVLPHLKLFDSGSFIKDIDYGNPKNKELGKFLMNNVVYQKSNNFYCSHDLGELEKICRAWKNIPLDGINAKKYRKVLSLCDLFFYKKINHIPFSREAIYWKMAEKDYIEAEKVFLEGQNVPEHFDTKKDWKCGEYVGRFLPRNDVRVGFFGNYTGCCQHFTGVGRSAAISCIKDEPSQLFVVEKNGRIIAGSLVWQTNVKDAPCVCFDSVEVLSSYEKRKEIYLVYKMACDDLSKTCSQITFGKTPFDLETRVKPLPVPVNVYSDARAQFILPDLQKN